MPAMEDDSYVHPDRFPGNVPGPFYTTGAVLPDGTWYGDCMRCGVPEMVAPTLLSPLTEEDDNTYFVRQPQTEQEIDQACKGHHVVLRGCTTLRRTRPPHPGQAACGQLRLPP